MADTPRQAGFRMPAEWEPHRATWLSWPHEPTTWPGKLTMAEHCMARWVRALTASEAVEINVRHMRHERHVRSILHDWDVSMEAVRLHHIPTNDCWIRDYGPTFITRPGQVAVVDWKFDGWGGKGAVYYGAADGLDNRVPSQLADILGYPIYHCGQVMEGGAIDVDGAGTLMATRDCLMESRGQPDRQEALEQALHDFLGVTTFIWLDSVPFEGDDTDGHVDNLARFVSQDTVVAAADRKTVAHLERSRNARGKQLNVVPIELPSAFGRARQQFPASYLNFYIANEVVLVPTYADRNDMAALQTLQECFPGRAVIGIDCCDFILGQGAIHCSTQQEPAS